MKPVITLTTVGLVSLALSSAAAARPVSAPQANTVAKPTIQTNQAAPATTRGPAQTGQPNQSCGSATAPNTPGNAAAAPGSAFNPSGQAGTVYAGQQPQNSRNTASVSQYDVACAHQR